MPEKLNKEVQSKLSELGAEIYGQIERGEFPRVKMASRTTSNIVFDEELNQFILGKQMAVRSASNIKQVRSLTQLLWVASFARRLVNEGKSTTLRDLYYHSLNYGIKFRDQTESDDTVTDLETLMTEPREAFNIYPKERSAIFGDVTIEYTSPEKYRGKRVNLSSNPDGVMVGLSLSQADFIECKADKVFVIEKNAIFRRFIEERVYEKFNAVLIDTAGQAPEARQADHKEAQQGAGATGLPADGRRPVGDAHRHGHNKGVCQRGAPEGADDADREVGRAMGDGHQEVQPAVLRADEAGRAEDQAPRGGHALPGVRVAGGAAGVQEDEEEGGA